MNGRWQRLLMLVALLALLVAPVRAHHDESRQIVTIKDEEASVLLLPKEEVARIKQLQSGAKYTAVLTEPSPDGDVVLARRGSTIGFLGLQDGGAFTPLDLRPLVGRYSIQSFLDYQVKFVWRDADTLATFARDVSGPTYRDSFPVILLINRHDGTARGERITLPPWYGYSSDGLAAAIDIAPDASHLLILRLMITEAARPPVNLPEGFATSPMLSPLPITWPRIAQPLDGIELPPDLAAVVEPVPVGSPPVRLHVASDGLFGADGDSLRMAADYTIALTFVAFDTATSGTVDLRTMQLDTGLLGWTWSPDGWSLIIGFVGLFDYDETEPLATRPARDGARLADQIYRDATGQQDPASNPMLAKNTMEVFDLATGERQILWLPHEDGRLLLSAAWSTDSQIFMVTVFHAAQLDGRPYPVVLPQFAERASFRFYDRSLREIGRLEAPELTGPWSTSGTFMSPSEVVFASVAGVNRSLYYYHLVSGEFRPLLTMPGTASNALAVIPQRQALFRHQSFTQPPELYRLNLDGSGFSRLTWDNIDFQQKAVGLRQDPVRFTLASGEEREGVLIQPAGAPFPPVDTPIIVWQEGGPGGAMVNYWAASVERPFALLPSFDFALLVVPLAGREGYDAATLNALADGHNFGQVDIDEQAEIVRQMMADGWTSPGKVGITGCSYGGYFALQSIARHPHLYTAANPQCALSDVFNEWTEGYATLLPYLEGDAPFVDHDEFVADSPVYNVERIRAAVLTFHGQDDFLPETIARNLHHQLLLQGTPTRMVSFADSGHGLTNSAYQLYAAQEQIFWFREHLAR